MCKNKFDTNYDINERNEQVLTHYYNYLQRREQTLYRYNENIRTTETIFSED